MNYTNVVTYLQRTDVLSALGVSGNVRLVVEQPFLLHCLAGLLASLHGWFA